jgi:hypothetical protein
MLQTESRQPVSEMKEETAAWLFSFSSVELDIAESG